MSVVLAILLSGGQDITVGGFDRSAPKVLIVGSSEQRVSVAHAAKRCGIPATWEYDGALWAHRSDVSPIRIACLRAARRATSSARRQR